MRRAVAILLLAGIVAGGLAAAAGLSVAEPASAFGSAGPRALVEEAESQGLGVSRFSSSSWVLVEDRELTPERVLLVVVAPARPFSPAEADAAAGFVARGGHLFVADSFGHAGSLTSTFGFTFERVRVVEDDPSTPWHAKVGAASYAMELPSPTAIKLAAPADAQILAATSQASFVDRDGDGLIGAADPRGPFPLMVRVPHGNGAVVAVADAGLLLEAAGEAENRALLAALLQQMLPDGGHVLIDDSRATRDPLVRAMAAAASAATDEPFRYLVLAAAGLTLLGLVALQGARPWRRHRFRPDRFVRRQRGSLASRPATGGSSWTDRGTAALACAAILSAAALAFGSREAAYAGAILAMGACLAALPDHPKIKATRTLSATVLHEEGDVEVGLEVRRPFGLGRAVELRDTVPAEFDLRDGSPWCRTFVRPGRSSTVGYTLSPALRGPYGIGPLRARTRDVLGLRHHEFSILEPSTVRVHPRREDVREVPFRTRVPTITLGPHLVNRAGEGSEFHALRPYQTGDSIRIVNWKASARSPNLVVNQRVHESMARLTIFLDARAIAAAGPAARAPIAHGCRAVLSVAAGALRIRDRIRIVVYGQGVQDIPSMPASRQLHELTELLSGLPAGGETPFAEAVQRVLPTLKKGNPVMLASGLEGDPTVMDGMRTLLAHGLLPFVVASPIGVAPVDPEDGGPEPDAARLVEARRRTVAGLQATGIAVFDAVANVPLDHLFRTGGGR